LWGLPFCGELASHHHAWVAGPLDPAHRVANHIKIDKGYIDKGRGSGRPHLITMSDSPALPRSLIFDSQEIADNWHLWGLVEEA